jgi:hypothetical protein
VPRPVEGVSHDAELALAPDELRPRLVRDVHAETRVRGERCPDWDRLRLSLRLDRLSRFVIDSLARRAVGRLVREDAVHRRRALEACRGVDDIARGHALAGSGLRVEVHERFSPRDPDAELEPLLEREVADREGGADGSLGVVLVGNRSAEQRHDGVADELLDRPSVPLEL